MRQVILLRHDLLARPNWTLGSVIAQAIHASIDCLHQYRNDTNVIKYTSDGARGSMTTIILEVRDEAHMGELKDALLHACIDHTIWVEQPENMATAIALKPYEKEGLPSFLKSLKSFGKINK